MKTITIVGGGWLGRPLAQYLKSIGHQTYTSKTTIEGTTELQSFGLNSFVCDLSQGPESLQTQLLDYPSDIVIGCFPPGFRRGQGDEYVTYWNNVIEASKNTGVKRVVMVSSTTVYPNMAQDMVEEDASLVKAENDDKFSDNAKIMLKAENLLISSGLKFAIVRCSGLIGPNRHPARFVAHLAQVSSKAPANMIHLQDAVGAVSYMAMYEKSAVVNATTPNTVSKAEFYQAALDAINSQESLPEVTEQPDKRIIADKLQSLGYRFHHQHTLELV